MIVFHGFGDSMKAFMDLPEKWALEKTAYLFLNGCDGLPSLLELPKGKGYSWFDYFDIDKMDWYEEFDTRSVENCERNAKKLAKLLDVLVTHSGWRLDQIFLFGFSQGGTYALDFLFSHPHVRLGGVLGVSTCLLGARRREINALPSGKAKKGKRESAKTPVLLIHGDDDEMLSARENRESVLSLTTNKEGRGAQFDTVVHKMFPARGHTMLRGQHKEEMRVFYEFVADNFHGISAQKNASKTLEQMAKDGEIVEVKDGNVEKIDDKTGTRFTELD